MSLHKRIKNVQNNVAVSFIFCTFAPEKDLNINILGLKKEKNERRNNWNMGWSYVERP